MNADYVRTVQLLLGVAPAIFDTPAFAMKGGTALNLFLQEMPRLSVDIDVVFVPHALPREEALRAIGDELVAAQARVEALGFSATLRKSREGNEAKLFVNDAGVEVNVEVNFVFRGTVLPPERRALTKAAQQMFSANIEVSTLAAPELYGGKLVAALDRQHPRDLFDVQLMLSGGDRAFEDG
jgi:predicted nucleotidyltransferase component of viral defense system